MIGRAVNGQSGSGVETVASLGSLPCLPAKVPGNHEFSSENCNICQGQRIRNRNPVKRRATRHAVSRQSPRSTFTTPWPLPRFGLDKTIDSQGSLALLQVLPLFRHRGPPWPITAFELIGWSWVTSFWHSRSTGQQLLIYSSETIAEKNRMQLAPRIHREKNIIEIGTRSWTRNQPMAVHAF